MRQDGQRRRHCTAAGVGALATLAFVAAHAAGALDPTFGSGGKVLVDNGGKARGIARDGHGNIYLGATGSIGNKRITVVKMDTQGNLVTSFGINGSAVIDNGTGTRDIGASIAIDSAGNVFIGGSSGTADAGDAVVIKLDPTGHLATGFGNGGKVRVDFGSASEEDRASALDAAGNVFIAGDSSTSGAFRFAAAKLDAGGQLVTAWGLDSGFDP